MYAKEIIDNPTLLNNITGGSDLLINCDHCNTVFSKTCRNVKRQLFWERRKNIIHFYCSKQCSNKSQIRAVEVHCFQCAKKNTKLASQIKKSKSTRSFCNNSCSAIYNNANKTIGTRISKLEVYLQEQLTLLYPSLEIHFNQKDTINSELDIYIPSLKLAFELNGIFHYEPIFGADKLAKIQNNDSRKFQACLEKGIEFCIIDSSKMINFKIDKAKLFLDIIINILATKW